jgi:transcriptional regulatory protein GAL4
MLVYYDFILQKSAHSCYRHLTEVEEELARTKALLKQLRPQQRNSSISNSQFSPVPGDNLEEENENPPQCPSQDINPPRSAVGSYIGSSHPPPSSFTQEQNVSSTRPRGMSQSPGMHFDNGMGQTTTPQNNHATPNTDTISRSNWSTMLSLESPPTSGNFEWDERGGKVGGQKFVDGMGSLTSDVNGSGYLGICSSFIQKAFQN